MEEAFYGTVIVVVVLGAWLSLPLLYMAPTYIARYRKHPAATHILVVNLLWGWTVIGWVIAMFMAFGSLTRFARLRPEKESGKRKSAESRGSASGL